MKPSSNRNMTVFDGTYCAVGMMQGAGEGTGLAGRVASRPSIRPSPPGVAPPYDDRVCALRAAPIILVRS